MNKLIRIVVCAALPLVWAAGCTDFLTCSECEEDPNNQVDASRDSRFVAVQATQWSTWAGDLPRTIAMWMQQMTGVGAQYQGQGTYIHNEGSFDISFRTVYISGGLIDLRIIQEQSRELNDRTYLGIAQVWEAYTVGSAASLWGDIPYSQAVNPEFPTPVLDPQEEVYAAVQALLDDAIANLESGEGAGPGAVDLVYGGDAASWVALAHTLKARYYMHWVEAEQAGGAAAAAAAVACGGDCVAGVLANVPDGIASPAGDFVTSHRDVPGEKNPWFQFIVEQRPGQISPGEYFIDLLRARNDPRLSGFFVRGSSATQIVGAPIGADFNNTWALLNPASRGAPDFAQPLVTWAENQLLWAEAAYYDGDIPTAQNRLNAVKAQYGSTAPTPAGGAALLADIVTEKYIALFQDFEIWSDYKRTCVPALTPAPGHDHLPGRLYYAFNERQTNPNIPSVAEQDANPLNANDPAFCP